MSTADTSHAKDSPGARAELSDGAIELIVARLRVIAEPTRVRLLQLLNGGDATVQELADQMPTTHQNVSRHLGLLHQAGMLHRTRDGKTVRYGLQDWTGWWLVEQIGSSVTAHLEDLQQAFAPQPDRR